MESTKPKAKAKSPIKPRRHALNSTKDVIVKLELDSEIITSSSNSNKKNTTNSKFYSPAKKNPKKKPSEVPTTTIPSTFRRSEKRSSTMIHSNGVPPSIGPIKVSSKLEQNKNFRDYMEDYLVSISGYNKNSCCHLFCIFDGHGGKETAELCSKHFPNILQKKIISKPFDIEGCLVQSFINMEKELEKKKKQFLEVGNTATVVYIDNKMLWVANVGDSSCLLIEKNNANFISIKDDFSNKDEIKRVESMGAKIIDDRLEGELAVSRSLGDFDLKGKGLICVPHVNKFALDSNTRYCILASDGIWDDLGPEDVLKICNEKKEPDDISNEMIKKALESGSEDNISCIVVKLSN